MEHYLQWTTPDIVSGDCADAMTCWWCTRSADAYAKRQAAETARRERKQTEYVEAFRGAVLAFLDFAPRHALLAEQLADAVTKHATPEAYVQLQTCTKTKPRKDGIPFQ